MAKLSHDGDVCQPCQIPAVGVDRGRAVREIHGVQHQVEGVLLEGEATPLCAGLTE